MPQRGGFAAGHGGEDLGRTPFHGNVDVVELGDRGAQVVGLQVLGARTQGKLGPCEPLVLEGAQVVHDVAQIGVLGRVDACADHEDVFQLVAVAGAVDEVARGGGDDQRGPGKFTSALHNQTVVGGRDVDTKSLAEASAIERALE